MKMIVCLGNPGKKYQKNRHNIGFLAGEYLCKKFSINPNRKMFDSFLGQGSLNGTDCMVLVPHTFMNLSGKSVNQAVRYFKIEIKDIIVIHDEIELAFGDIRTKFGGGHKGHNGLRSIMQECGSGDFWRIRFGVGRPTHPDIPVADFVLSDFTNDEFQKMDLLLQELTEKITGIIDETITP